MNLFARRARIQSGMVAQVAAEWEGPVSLDDDVAGFRRPDPDALAALVTRYQNRLYRSKMWRN